MSLLKPSIMAALLLTVSWVSPIAAIAAPKHPKTVLVDQAWFTTMPNNGPTFGYFRIRNRGDDARLMTGFSTPACADLKLEEAHGGGTNSKAAVQMTVAAKGTLVFSRGGYHLVCERGSNAAPSPGQTIPVTIMLDGGATMPVRFAVRPLPH